MNRMRPTPFEYTDTTIIEDMLIRKRVGDYGRPWELTQKGVNGARVFQTRDEALAHIQKHGEL